MGLRTGLTSDRLLQVRADQTQPGRIATHNPLSGYDIGSAQERTNACAASVLLYNS